MVVNIKDPFEMYSLDDWNDFILGSIIEEQKKEEEDKIMFKLLSAKVVNNKAVTPDQREYNKEELEAVLVKCDGNISEMEQTILNQQNGIKETKELKTKVTLLLKTVK